MPGQLQEHFVEGGAAQAKFQDVETGGVELANELHTQGYDRIRRAYPDADQANKEMVEKEEPTVAVV